MNRGVLRRVERAFADRFGGAPSARAWAPGRVNLIGEHTDYNDGFVLPIAIERGIAAAGRARRDRTTRLLAVDLDESAEVDLSRPEEFGGGAFPDGGGAFPDRGGAFPGPRDAVDRGWATRPGCWRCWRVGQAGAAAWRSPLAVI